MTVAVARSWAQEAGIWLPAPPRVGSREVSFSVGLEWAAPYLASHADLAMFGTPAWRDEHDQKRKTAAAVVAALMWSLDAERRRDARIEASNEISDELDWREESKHIGRRDSTSYIPRKGAA